MPGENIVDMPTDVHKQLRDEKLKNKQLRAELLALQNSKQGGPLGRSSLEAYAAILIAITLALSTMTWWLRALLFIIVCAGCSDFVWRSPATYKWPKGSKIALAVAVSAAVAYLGVQNVASHYRQDNLPPDRNYAQSWGQADLNMSVIRTPSGPPFTIVGETGSKVIVDGRMLTKWADDYRVMVVCFHYTGAVDADDVENLSKSQAFDITGGSINILIPWSSAFIEEVRTGRPGTNYKILLIPLGLPITAFETLREAKKKGAMLVQTMHGPP